MRLTAILALFVLACSYVHAADVDPALQAKIDNVLKDIKTWAADPAIIEAVKLVNATPPAEYKDMTQEKWKSLPVTDPFVRSFAKNDAAKFLKTKKSDVSSEAFVSAADGTKVAFLAKTSGWSHKGKPKHDEPMAGKTWQGAIEVDDSTGVQQIQISVPVLDGEKPIGSLVVGLNVTKLKE